MTLLAMERDPLAVALGSHDPGLEPVLDRRAGEIIPGTDATGKEEGELAAELEEGVHRCMSTQPIPSSEGIHLRTEFASFLWDATFRRLREDARRDFQPFRRVTETLEQWPGQGEAWFSFHDRSRRARARPWLGDEAIEADRGTGPRQAP